MKELLTEFLSNLLNEERVVRKPGTVWATAGKKWAAKRNDGTYESGFESEESARKWLAGVKKSVGGTKDKSSPTQPETPTVGQKKPSNKQKTQTPIKRADAVETPKTIEASIQQLPGGNGVINAVKGIIEKGSAGAGTPESRAAEASVVLVVNHLLTLRTSDVDAETFLKENNEVINSIIKELSTVKGSKLKPDWHSPVKNQIVTAFSQIEKNFGRIQKIVWDNEEGRTAVGIKKKAETDRSDMYVITEDGRVIGVSLKKDGNVFLANQGYAKTIDDISRLASPNSKQALQDLKMLHKERSKQQAIEMLDYVVKNHESIGQDLSKLARDQIGDVGSETYDFLFDETGKISPQFIEKFNDVSKKFQRGEITDIGQVFTSKNGFGEKTFKLLMKSLTTLSTDESANTSKELKMLLLKRRNVNREVTHALVKAIQTNPDIKSAVTGYMLETLDIPQTLFPNPFDGVSHVVTAYGDGTVDKDGNDVPMFVDNNMLRKTLNIPEDAGNKETIRLLKERFIIDAEADARAGMIRLKLVNDNPPPAYFYPTVATMEVRERGLGTPAVFELHQHDAWTAAISNRDVNPANWSESQRKKNANETVKFLTRRLNDPITTDEERAEIEKDLDFYNEILLSLTKPNKAKRK